jgi:hypothetical protein
VKVLEYCKKKLKPAIEMKGLECGNTNDKIYMYVARFLVFDLLDFTLNHNT